MMIRSLLPSIVVNGVLTYLVYSFMKSQTSASDLVALLVASVPVLIGEVVTISRRRQLDVLGAFVLMALVVSAAVSALGGDAKLLLVRESFITAAFGVVCLASLLLPQLSPRPLLFYIIRYFVTGNDPAKAATFDARWQNPAFRRYMSIVTLVFGVVFLVEFAVRLYLVYTLSIKQFLAVGPIVFYAMLFGTIAFAISYRRRAIPAPGQ
jgi:hypothetical protein